MILFRTSIRKLKPFFFFPIGLFDLIFSKIFNLIPHLNFKYNKHAAIIDTDSSLFQDTQTKEEWVELKIKDIKNKKLRYSLYLSGIFKPWKVFYTKNMGERDFNKSDNNRDLIYLSKDKINILDGRYYGDRISDYYLNKSYSNKNLTKYLKKFGLKYEEFYKIEPQTYAVVALKSYRHDNMMKERDIIYKAKSKHAIEKTVKKAIKEDRLTSYISFYGNYSDLPLIHKVVKENRIDLVKMMLDSRDDDEERSELVNEIGKRDSNFNKKPIDYAKTDEMKNLLNNWMDLEKYDRYRKIIKIKKGIK